MNRRRTKKNDLLLKMARQFREETGNEVGALDSGVYAEWLLSRGWRAPRPRTEKELLMRDIGQAFRTEYRRDEETGLEYRANLAIRKTVMTDEGPVQHSFWIDPDVAAKSLVHKALSQRRTQILGDALGLSNDIVHFNGTRGRTEGEISMSFDFTDDIDEERALQRQEFEENEEHNEGEDEGGFNDDSDLE